MGRVNLGVLIGLALIGLGVLTLLDTFKVLVFPVALLWVLVFGAAGAAFLWAFLTNRAQWWAIIPAFVLFGIALSILVPLVAPALNRELPGAVFLAAIGLAFWVVYLNDRQMWWAIIPGGTLITLAAITLLAPILPGAAGSGLLFLGLGLTFGLLYLAPTRGERMTWAIYPAVVLVLLGLLLGAFSSAYVNLVWPAALVVLGLFLLARTFRPA